VARLDVEIARRADRPSRAGLDDGERNLAPVFGVAERMADHRRRVLRRSQRGPRHVPPRFIVPAGFEEIAGVGQTQRLEDGVSSGEYLRHGPV
jgi:hypothetical protein